MASYGYGYGTFTSQPQQYAAASYASQNGSYGYAASPPVSRVVQGYQQPAAAAAYATTAFAQPQVPVASAGYGYFQRGSDPSTAAAYATPTAQKTSQAYGYGTTAAVKTTTYAGTTYQKPNAYVSATATVTPATTSHQNAYEKVVYNAATSFLTQQAQAAKPTWQKSEKPTFKLSSQGSKTWNNRNTGPPKVQQLHYCEVCKISCAGPQTYKEHLDGQKHKKKAAMSTSDTKLLAPGTYKCELCDVVCTGKDAYNAHVKGASHQKTHKLHQKLGKPIPEVKVFEGTSSEKKISEVKASAAGKITFVGGTKLTSTGGDVKAEDDESSGSQGDNSVEGEIIGEEYVEDIKSDAGKVIGYNCTLCVCRFNDVVAKTAHMKGRRHRLSYKKKVDPKLIVDMKGSKYSKNLKDRAGRVDEMAWKQRQHEQMRWEQQLRFREEELRRWEHEEFMRRSSEDRYWTRPDRNRMHELEYYEWERREKYTEPQALFPRPGGPPPQTPDDRLIMSKHKEIYPNESELKQVQSMVASAEKALKLVSDSLEEEKKAKAEVKKDEEGSAAKADNKSNPANRILKGVMRVGALAKGLLLQGQLSVELVVLCAEKPTYTLLKKIGKLVPEKLKEVAPDDKYNMSISIVECAIFINSTTEPKCSVKVALTSPSMREGDEEEKKEKTDKAEPVDPKDVLDKEKALQALAVLRHAKWFQARANHLASCVVTIRIMRELCHRVPAFKALNNWAIELLCEKALASSFQPLGPGEAFRRVMEAIASGIFLPGGSGLVDPCEKEKKDSAANMSAQEREDITGAAQHALRLQAFRQLHKVLAVEPLKPNPARMTSNPKRRAEENGSDAGAKVAKKE